MDAVRVERQALGLSQEALADKANIDRSYMGGIERGEHNIAIMNLLKIADALGIRHHCWWIKLGSRNQELIRRFFLA